MNGEMLGVHRVVFAVVRSCRVWTRLASIRMESSKSFSRKLFNACLIQPSICSRQALRDYSFTHETTNIFLLI